MVSVIMVAMMMVSGVRTTSCSRLFGLDRHRRAGLSFPLPKPVPFHACVQERTSRVIVVSKNNPDKIDLSLELRSPESLEIPRIVREETTARWLANGDEIFAWKNTLILSSNAQTIPRGERPIGVVSKRSTRGAANPEARAPTRTTHTMQQPTKKKINAPTLFLRSTPFSIRRNGVNHGKE